MRINQEKTGNIIIRQKGAITHILSSMSIQKHPRKENALLIYSKDFQNGQRGVEFLANQRVYINDNPYNLDAEALLRMFGANIVMNGSLPSINTTPKTKEQDPKYVEYLQANTYEKLLAFVKKYKSNIGGITKQGDKIMKEEFLCQFQTFILKVSLGYKYKTENPNLIDYILMFGGTQYVHKPKKVYVYDANNTITGYVYKEALED